MNTIYFGGGCFWCTEAIFLSLKGVISVTPGYMGGSVKNPTYEQVCSGKTGHVEITKVDYNPKIISLEDLLAVFFYTHDPTTRNRQGNDIGTQYQSSIFYVDDTQKAVAESLIAEMNTKKAYDKPVITDVRQATEFYKAEDYHQNYYDNHKSDGYCQLIIEPKLEKLQKRFEKLTLTKDEYEVLREKGTEAPFSGKLLHDERSGVYTCKVCGQPLFSSKAKFDSGTGWPSFDQALPGAVKTIEDNSMGMTRTEIICSKCGSHLGHLFNDGPTPTKNRYCLNSVCLDLDPLDK